MQTVEKNYLTIKQVATLVDKSPYTIRKWIRDGSLPAEKFPQGTPQGRWYVAEVDIPTFLRKEEKKVAL